MRRRDILWGATLAGLLPAAHATTPLPAAQDLQRSLEVAAHRHQVLVVLFSLPQCPWCELARRLSYADLVRQGQPVVQVEMAHDAKLRDLDGHPVDGRELASRLRVKLAPTALFLGPAGRELAERMVGVGAEDFYDSLVQQRLADARQAAGW